MVKNEAALENAQTASGFQSTIGLLILMSSTALVFVFALYLLYLSGKSQWLPGVPFVNGKIPGAEIKRMRYSIEGTEGFIMSYAPIFTMILVSFAIVTRLPPILSSETTREKLYNLLWNGVIPIGSVMFFVLLVFRFLGSRMMGEENALPSTLMFLAIIIGVISTGIVMKILIRPSSPQASPQASPQESV